MARRIEKADVINLGSTYAYYDFDYSCTQVRGVNLACLPQYLNMDLKFVKKYKEWLDGGKKVVIVLPNFVFAADALSMSRQNDVYYFKFLPRELEWFSVPGFASALWRQSVRRLKGGAKALLRRLLGRQPRKMTAVEKEAAADARIESWKRVLGIPSMDDRNVPERIQALIEKNIRCLNEIVRTVREAGGAPYIVVPPVSEIMNRKVCRECMQAYLFAPIESREDKSVPVFNYLYDKNYQSEELYRNADCLDRDGACRFTADVLARIASFERGENQ